MRAERAIVEATSWRRDAGGNIVLMAGAGIALDFYSGGSRDFFGFHTGYDLVGKKIGLADKAGDKGGGRRIVNR